MSALRVPRIRARTIIATLALLALLLVARWYSYPLFHTLAEMFAVTVAVAAFMVMWNSRAYIEDDYMLLIGVSFAFIAVIDILHLLTFKGVGFFPGISDDPPTQFWIAGRAVQAGVFLLAPSFIHRRPSIRAWAGWLTVITVALITAVVTGVFPSCLGPEGLTTFKIVTEYVIIAAFIGAFARLRVHRSEFDPETYLMVTASILVAAVAEASFTLYRDPFGPMNLVGHFLRILAFFLLYRATVVKALTEPYAVLFRELAEISEAQRQSERQVRRAKGFSDAMTAIDAQINATFDLDEIMRRVIVDGAQAIHADSASITIREGSSWVVRHCYRLPKDIEGMRIDDHLGRHLVAASTAGKPLVIKDAPSSDLIDASFAEAYRIRTLLSVPLKQSDTAIGVLTFHRSHADDPFTPESIDFAERLASALALAIDNARLYAAQQGVAEALQRPMLSLPTELPGVTIAHAYRSADEIALIGGDFYDALQLDDHRIVFFVGDVSGKGIDAAGASSMTRTTMRAFAYHKNSPAEVLTDANDVLYNMFSGGRYATVTLCVLDVRDGSLTLASAGHPDPYVCGLDGCLRHTADRDVPLGLFPDTAYSESRISLAPGQTILLYSDGLFDTRRGKEFFGEDRVHDIIAATASLPPAQIIDALVSATEDFSGRQYTDDIALMAVRYSPGSDSSHEEGRPA